MIWRKDELESKIQDFDEKYGVLESDIVVLETRSEEMNIQYGKVQKDLLNVDLS